MTHEPPDRAGRHRSEAASRLAALLAEIETAEQTPGPPAAPASVPAPPRNPEIAAEGSVEALGTDSLAQPNSQEALAEPDTSLAARTLLVAAVGTSPVTEPVLAPPPAAGPPPAVESESLPAPGIESVGGPVPPPVTPPEVEPVPPVASEMVTIAESEAPEVRAAEVAAVVTLGRAGLVSAPPAEFPVPTVAEPSPESSNGHAPPEIAAQTARAQLADATAAPEVPEVEGLREHVAPPERERSWLRRLAFGTTTVLLIAAIPALAYVGKQSLFQSKAGKVEAEANDPTAPGFTQFIDPTPTALVVHRNAKDEPIALTLLALGNGESGGSVLFIPMDTNVVRPALFIDRLRTAYAKGGNKTFLTQVGSLLNVGFTSVVDLDDADWAQVVAPVAPLTIDNPVNTAGEDSLFPAGTLQLQADQVGPYLNSTAQGQDDLDRLDRHKLVWEAWMDAIATSTATEPVPNTLTGIGPYVSTLAAGESSLDTLAVTPATLLAPDGATAFQPDVEAMRTQLTDAVPAPISPGLGDRYSVRVLNGVRGEPIPDELIRTLVYGGAQIDATGNAAVFGQPITRIEYRDPNRRETARAVQFLLGGGTVVLNRASTDTVDLVITLGSDVLDD